MITATRAQRYQQPGLALPCLIFASIPGEARPSALMRRLLPGRCQR